MSLLEVKGLTMRFGGLTAVSAVDFAVEPGTIASLIGPNGAGKTTLFNAVTGVYAPTEGGVRFEGQPLRRPFRARIAVRAAAAGLLTAGLLAVLSADVDGLWRTAVVANTPDPGEPFPARKALGDFWRVLTGRIVAEAEPNRLTELEVKPQGGAFVVRSRTNRAVLETLPDEDAANRRLETLSAMVSLSGSIRTTEPGEGKWLVATPAREIVGAFDSEEAARRRVQDLRDLAGAAVVKRNGCFALAADTPAGPGAGPSTSPGAGPSTSPGAGPSTSLGAGRTIVEFAQRFEAEDYKAQWAFAREAAAEPATGRWLVTGPGGAVLEALPSRDAAKARLMLLAVAAGKLRWRLATRVSVQPLGFAPASEQAAADIRSLEQRIALGASAPIEDRDGRAVVLSSDRARVLASFATRAEAAAAGAALADVGRARTRARLLLVLALVAGLGLGAGGALVVWSRARRTPDVVARRGLGRTFQNIRLFPDLTAAENVLVGMDRWLTARPWQMALRTPAVRREEEAARARAVELLAFVGLAGRADDRARNLPYGAQRRLEIARALGSRPALLLLDEPAAGMNPSESADLMALIRRIRDTGVTVLLIEHDMKVVMGISDRITVLDHGAKIAEGAPAEIKADPKVIEAYLGRPAE